MKPDFSKYADGLVPAIIQDNLSQKILMLGFMNEKAFQKSSYTSSLFAEGISKIAQKVGEEAIELIIEAKDNDETKFKNEAADLLFHYLVLLRAKDLELADIVNVFAERHR